MISKNVVPFNFYTGDDTTILFAAQFPTFETESLLVTVTEIVTEIETALVDGVDYTPANLGVNGIDGTISLIDSNQAWLDAIGNGLSDDYTITLRFCPDAFQPGSFRALGNYSPITLEQVFDRLTMAIKAIKQDADDLTVLVLQNITDIATNAVAIAANLVRIIALETFVFSKTQALADGTGSPVNLTAATINELVDQDMVMEYVVRRGTAIQYGKLLITNSSPFVLLTLQKIGEAGVVFAVTEGGGIGQVNYDTTVLTTGTIRYTLKKFTL